MNDNTAGVSYALIASALIAFLIFNIRSCVQAETTEAMKAGLVQGEFGRWQKPVRVISAESVQ